MPAPTSTQNARPVDAEMPLAGRGRIPVAEVWFDKPLPRLAQGAAYIGSGEGWTRFKVLADLDARTMIIALPDKRVFRVPFENIVAYVQG